jgi:hypothetical protein
VAAAVVVRVLPLQQPDRVLPLALAGQTATIRIGSRLLIAPLPVLVEVVVPVGDSLATCPQQQPAAMAAIMVGAAVVLEALALLAEFARQEPAPAGS